MSIRNQQFVACNQFLFPVNFFFRRVSIIRGQVLTERGEGLVGVRVSVSGARGQGFTLTRYEGATDKKKRTSDVA